MIGGCRGTQEPKTTGLELSLHLPPVAVLFGFSLAARVVFVHEVAKELVAFGVLGRYPLNLAARESSSRNSTSLVPPQLLTTSSSRLSSPRRFHYHACSVRRS